jgi:hypothetical protein
VGRVLKEEELVSPRGKEEAMENAGAWLVGPEICVLIRLLNHIIQIHTQIEDHCSWSVFWKR